MTTEGFVIPANLIIHCFDTLTENTALADSTFAAVGDILDLTVTVHVLCPKVPAAENIVHQALKGRIIYFTAFDNL